MRVELCLRRQRDCPVEGFPPALAPCPSSAATIELLSVCCQGHECAGELNEPAAFRLSHWLSQPRLIP